MKTSAIAALLVASALVGHVSAQITTDEARAQAAQATASQQRSGLTRAPQAEAVSPDDYRGAAHDKARVAQWQTRQASARAYLNGARSQAIAVNSGDSARAEAARLTAQAVLADHVDTLRLHLQ